MREGIEKWPLCKPHSPASFDIERHREESRGILRVYGILLSFLHFGAAFYGIGTYRIVSQKIGFRRAISDWG